MNESRRLQKRLHDGRAGAWLSSQLADPHWVFPVLVTVAVWVLVSLLAARLSDGEVGLVFVVFLCVISVPWFWYLRDDHPTAAWWVLGTPCALVCAFGVAAVWPRS